MVRAYDAVWFIGDDFASRSFEQYFQQRDHTEYKGYVKEYYDTLGFVSSKFLSLNQNMVSCIRNTFANVIKEKVLLPKLVILCFDDDLIKCIDYTGPGLGRCLGCLINAIMVDFDCLVQAQKEYLPRKSKKNTYPQFIWIEAPIHDNFHNNDERKIFNEAVIHAAQLHENVSVLQLKKIWDQENTRLYISESRRFTSEGLAKYWMAIDWHRQVCRHYPA